jgi:hypothetical protein
MRRHPCITVSPGAYNGYKCEQCGSKEDLHASHVLVVMFSVSSSKNEGIVLMHYAAVVYNGRKRKTTLRRFLNLLVGLIAYLNSSSVYISRLDG